MTKKLTDIKVVDKKTNAMLKAITELDVTNTEAVQEMTKNIRTVKAWVKQEKDKYVAPAKEIIAKAKEQYDPLIKGIETAEREFKGKVTAHLMAEKKKQDEKQQKLADRVERGTMKAETAVRKMEEMGEVKKSTGGVKVKMIKDYRIVDESKIPDEYWKRELIKSAIRTDAITKGKTIPGIEVYEKPSASF